MKEIKVAMVIAKETEGSFLAMKKNLERTEKERYIENPWETAGGKIEKNEPVPEAAIRELNEEGKLSGIYTGPEEYPRDDLRIEHQQKTENGEQLKIDFYPVPIEVDQKCPDLELSEEHQEYKWLSAEEFEQTLPPHNVEGFHKVREYLI